MTKFRRVIDVIRNQPSLPLPRFGVITSLFVSHKSMDYSYDFYLSIDVIKLMNDTLFLLFFKPNDMHYSSGEKNYAYNWVEKQKKKEKKGKRRRKGRDSEG